MSDETQVLLQFLDTEREQDLICRHASLRSRRVNSLFVYCSPCSGWY